MRFINVPAARLLRRHVTNGSQDRAQVGLNQQQRFVSRHRCRHFLFGELCNPEVEHFHVAVRPKHDVLRLDVAMDNPAWCAAASALATWIATSTASLDLHSPAHQTLTQRLAFDQFTGNVMN